MSALPSGRREASYPFRLYASINSFNASDSSSDSFTSEPAFAISSFLLFASSSPGPSMSSVSFPVTLLNSIDSSSMSFRISLSFLYCASRFAFCSSWFFLFLSIIQSTSFPNFSFISAPVITCDFFPPDKASTISFNVFLTFCPSSVDPRKSFNFLISSGASFVMLLLILS